MDRFPCKGTLTVTLTPGESKVQIHVRHEVEHVPYCDISIPEHWRKYIQEQCEIQTPGQVSTLLRF
jgi:hypothetical protein